MQLLMRILIKGNHLAKQAFNQQLPMATINKILHHAISLKRNTMIIINQLLRFYTLFYLRSQCFVSRVLFIVNILIFLLLMILSYTVFPVLFKRYSYSAMDCAIPMNRCLIRHGSNNLGRTPIDDNLRFLQLLLCNSLYIGKVSPLRRPVSLTQYRGTVVIFNNRLFVCALKYNNFSLISSNKSQDQCFLDCDFYHNDIRFTFFLIFLMLLTLKRKTYKSTIYFSVLSFLTIAFNVSIATWVYSILIALNGGV